MDADVRYLLGVPITASTHMIITCFSPNWFTVIKDPVGRLTRKRGAYANE